MSEAAERDFHAIAEKAKVMRVVMREHGRYPGHSIDRTMSQIVEGEIASYYCDKCGLRVTPAQLPFLKRRDGVLPGDKKRGERTKPRYTSPSCDSAHCTDEERDLLDLLAVGSVSPTGEIEE